jgi:hypothetical protein
MKKKYWYCPRDWMGQRTGEWRSVELTEEEAARDPRFLYENEADAMWAALS